MPWNQSTGFRHEPNPKTAPERRNQVGTLFGQFAKFPAGVPDPAGEDGRKDRQAHGETPPTGTPAEPAGPEPGKSQA